MPSRFTPVLITMLLCHQALPQQSLPADPLIHISLTLTRARESSRACALDQADSWTRKAIDEIDRFRSVSPRERDTAAALKVQADASREEIRALRKHLELSTAQLEKSVQEARLESAQHLLDRLRREAPACAPRFQEIAAEVKRHTQEAQALAREGDHLAGEGRSKAALRLYQKAWVINHQLENYPARVESAWADRASRRHPVLKAVAWTLLAASMTAGGYIAFEHYTRKPAATPPATVWSPR